MHSYLGAAAACLVLAASASAQDAGDARRGLTYVRNNCASCHAVERDVLSSPQPGVASFSAIAGTPGMTGIALSVWLQSTHRDMPNFIIAPDDRSDIIAYIVSLRAKP